MASVLMTVNQVQILTALFGETMEILEVKIIIVCANADGLGFKLAWTDDNGYFGEISFATSEAGNHTCIDSENMSKDFVKKVLAKLVDDAELVE